MTGRKRSSTLGVHPKESTDEWEAFLVDAIRRGLTGEKIEVISVDGGKGLINAVRSAYPLIPIQRCWAHKMRNILDKVKKGDHKAVKKGLVAIYTAKNMNEPLVLQNNGSPHGVIYIPRW
ncbi:MAG: transposase [Syntrophorhabdaceae bacterium]|nr:transposase [Syntrophorhabdaceae bacterium]